ncbi:MAG TPA: FxLYD domain-containing protein [Candidatus Acidoferrum sp.]|nr:FxLYD domain-containing protein [Candidatus Acidoferrum sp.]
MRRALETVVTCAVVAVLIQGCAGGMTQSAPSTSASASAQSYGVYGMEGYFPIDWQAGERRGQPIVTGHVTNAWGIGVNNVRMRIEALDPAGGVTATYIGYVFGDVTPGTRAYFEVPVPQKAPSYRVSVLSFDPQQCRG